MIALYMSTESAIQANTKMHLQAKVRATQGIWLPSVSPVTGSGKRSPKFNLLFGSLDCHQTIASELSQGPSARRSKSEHQQVDSRKLKRTDFAEHGKGL